MKPKYSDTIERFLADQGPMFRFYNRRWWMIKEGYWELVGREGLIRAVGGYMRAFAPPLISRDFNQADLNQVCAFLARKLYTNALPARAYDPAEDPRVLFWDVRPKQYLD
jgi:hypothetical protein